MLAALLAQAGTIDRFDLASPLPNIPAVRIDKVAAGVGVAQQTARAHGWQARMLWVDATANLGNYNTEERVIALVERAHRMGFNTIVLDVKPIIGYTIYPSALTDQLTQWRTHTQPKGYDPVAIMLRECRKKGLMFFVCLNAFSEGHQLARSQTGNQFANGKAGPGYDHPEEQSVQYRPVPVLRIGDFRIRLAPAKNSMEGGDAGLYDRRPPSGATGILIRSDRTVAPYDGEELRAGERIILVAPPFQSMIPTSGRAVIESEARFLRSGEEQNQVPLMMNPSNFNVLRRSLAFVDEITARYDIDGIMFDDRMRFTGMDGDFSAEAMRDFEARVGKKLQWPRDAYEITFNWDLGRGVRPGRYWDSWWSYRASVISNWVRNVRYRIDQAAHMTQFAHGRPHEVRFGIYAGSWYGEYDNYGANWGSREMAAGFPFLTRAFRDQGFADQLDFFVAGCYYPVATIYDAMVEGRPEGRTVEAASITANRVINDDAWTIAGVSIEALGSNPTALQKAIQAAAATSQGVMVFDNSHNIERFESDFAKAFARPSSPPYARASRLQDVRHMKRAREARGAKPPPIFIYPGAPGAGF